MSDQPTDAPPSEPAFGLIDVIEAFTAMRHEFRTQSIEDRKLADQLSGAIERIERLQQTIQQSVDQVPQNRAPESPDEFAAGDFRQLCETLAEIDHQLSRTIEIAVRSLGQDDQVHQQQDQAVEYFKQQVDLQLKHTGLLRRWLVRSWARRLQQSFASSPTSAPATISALRILHERVARLIRDAGVERIDVAGEPFDSSLMNAVESVASDVYPSGHVTFQLSPAYRWGETIIRYAEVHVSSG